MSQTPYIFDRHPYCKSPNCAPDCECKSECAAKDEQPQNSPKTFYVIVAKSNPEQPSKLCYFGSEPFETTDKTYAQSKAESLQADFGHAFPGIKYVVGTVTY